MTEDVEALAAAREDWKQAKYFIERLSQSLYGSDIDVESFREEFVDDEHPVDSRLFRLVEELAGAGEGQGS
jgi:hypothetical protein